MERGEQVSAYSGVSSSSPRWIRVPFALLLHTSHNLPNSYCKHYLCDAEGSGAIIWSLAVARCTLKNLRNRADKPTLDLQRAKR